MATQDFGLSFTVEIPALWNDAELIGKISETSTILADVLSLDKMSEASSLFADVVVLAKISEASTFSSTDQLCTIRNILAGPLSSTASGPLNSTLECA